MTKKNVIMSILDNSCPREDILTRLKEHPSSYNMYLDLPAHLQEEFLRFCEGTSSVWICYDPFFKKIFHPDMHPHRLERLIGAILGQKVVIIKTMTNEGTHITDRAAFVIMDIVVMLEDGTIVNLEIQKVSVNFPVKRTDCYSADLILREYTRLREENGRKFRYAQLPPVYTIVLFEECPEVFRADRENYIHVGCMRTDTGFELDSIVHQVYVALDIFKERMHNKPIETELEAWLTLMTAQELPQIEELISKFEGFAEIYQEIFRMRTKPEELIQMYSNIFYEADRNEDRAIIEEMQARIAEKDASIFEQATALSEQAAALSEKDATIAEQASAIAKLQEIINKLTAQPVNV